MQRLLLSVMAATLFASAQTGTTPNTTKTGGAQDQGQQTLTGTVSDAMCGKKHVMAGSAAQCVRACVKQGSPYALVSGDAVYNLVGHEQDLDKYAGQNVMVRGHVAGKTVHVDSVTPAQS